ncbi:MAG: PLP-dependent cysteine synthase family protein [Gemmatimonadaceae bacterium]
MTITPDSAGTRLAPGRHAHRVYDDVTAMLPDADNPTPLVRINTLNPRDGYTLYAKLEWLNPFGSVKDRAAWAMVRDLEDRGELGAERAGRGLVEPTSGNTGVSLAALASARGYGMRAVVPNKVPLEKKVTLKLAGAELDVVNDELCPLPGLGDGSINLARTHARAQPGRYVMPNQYANRANIQAHLETTGPEIWRQTAGRVTDVFVALGTAGTAMGLALYLKAVAPRVRVIAVQPTEGHDVPGVRSASQLEATELFDRDLIDEVIEVEHELAYERAMDLARREGLLAGPSSGLVLEGARRVLSREPGPGVGVLLFPDNSARYTSKFVQHLPELAKGTTP